MLTFIWMLISIATACTAISARYYDSVMAQSDLYTSGSTCDQGCDVE